LLSRCMDGSRGRIKNNRDGLIQNDFFTSPGKEWIDKHLKDGTYDCIHNFVDGGGIGIANVDSLEAAYDILSDFPGETHI